MQVQHIPVTNIIPGDNDRKTFNAIALQELADSIAANGLAQPITVRPVHLCASCESPHYAEPTRCPDCGGESFYPVHQVVAGERRLRAIRDLLKWPDAPCLVRDLDDETASAIMLAENTDRVDLNPIEEARAYQVRIERFEWSHEHVARVAGVSPEQVRRRLGLLSLAPDVQHLVASGNLSLAYAEAMTRLDVNRQRIALRALQRSESAPDIVMFRRLCSRLYEEQEQDTLLDLSEYFVRKLIEEAAKPRNGQHADTSHVPTRSDLPPVAFNRKDTTAIVIERWLQALLDEGYLDEAGAVGVLYRALVHARLVRVPYESTLIGE